jgi:hypothetical protein
VLTKAERPNPLPAKEMVMKKSAKAALKADANRKKTPPTRNKTTVAPKTEKSGPRAKLSASASGSEKLVWRYCCSDDLAPSFIKRRDARCGACFKQRHGAARRAKRQRRRRRLDPLITNRSFIFDK